MRKLYSLIACFIICAVVLQHRMAHIGPKPGQPLRVTDWDNLGYYMYLPGIFIYDDIKELKWIPAIDAKYGMVGSNFYQAEKCENGNYADKYLGGIAIFETPFFFAAHWYAKHYNYPADGFSPPYQYAVAFAAIFYALLGLFLLRRFLLKYYSDTVVAFSLSLLCLATNFLQYVAIDGGMSHAYIFLLYVLILVATKKWHDTPLLTRAAIIGYIIGWAMICRPTEVVMLFIPLMWNTHNKEAARAKWTIVRENKSHILFAIVFGFVGILPQLVYWKYVTGSWIYDVGSAWDFLTPHFNVLWGWEKGWFIYTPVTILFIIGMFFIKKQEWRKSVLWFCLLNIYIIISWRDWHYGASYSTRALMQSYPVFALPFTAMVDKINTAKWRWLFYVVGIYLIAVNIFQHEQYSKTILHYDDMNRKYYGRIYLNPNPTPLDMSLLDNDEVLNNEEGYKKLELMNVANVQVPVRFNGDTEFGFFNQKISLSGKETWLKVDCILKTNKGIWDTYLNTEIKKGDSVKHNRVRLFNALCNEGQSNRYIFYARVPDYFSNGELRAYISKNGEYDGELMGVTVTILEK